jgi:hypothetical protein
LYFNTIYIHPLKYSWPGRIRQEEAKQKKAEEAVQMATDMERLALVRKQREDAAKRKEEERKCMLADPAFGFFLIGVPCVRVNVRAPYLVFLLASIPVFGFGGHLEWVSTTECFSCLNLAAVKEEELKAKAAALQEKLAAKGQKKGGKKK